jgi:hypothetical protein
VGRRLYDLARTSWIDNDLIPINGVKTLRDHHHPSILSPTHLLGVGQYSNVQSSSPDKLPFILKVNYIISP